MCFYKDETECYKQLIICQYFITDTACFICISDTSQPQYIPFPPFHLSFIWFPPHIYFHLILYGFHRTFTSTLYSSYGFHNIFISTSKSYGFHYIFTSILYFMGLITLSFPGFLGVCILRECNGSFYNL